MKSRSLIFSAFLFLFVFLFSFKADARLLGVKIYEGSKPDIQFQSILNGGFTYDSESNLLEAVSVFDTLMQTEDSVYLLSNYSDTLVAMGLALYVDEEGRFVSGVNDHTYRWTFNGEDFSYTSDYDMVEVLLKGSITIDGKTYRASEREPVLLLAAEIDKFGYGETQDFDFVFKNVAGAFVEDEIWPSDSDGGFTAAYIVTSTWNGDWTQDQAISYVKGDKFHAVPEPSTIMLLGISLFGFGLIGLKKKNA